MHLIDITDSCISVLLKDKGAVYFPTAQKARRMQFKVSCILLENYLLKYYEGAISAKFQPSFHQWSARCVLTEELAVLRLLAHSR